MALNDAEAHDQIDQMVRFIKQEAQEKANEIGVSAEEEFNIEKLQLLEAEKGRVRKEYERREGQIDVKKKIEYSKQLNASRIKVLQAREDAVHSILEEARKKLASVSSDKKKYETQLTDLLVQSLAKLKQPAAIVKSREVDADIVKGIIEPARKKYAERFKTEAPQVKFDSDNFLPPAPGKQSEELESCSGGLSVSSANGTIVCPNTFDARLQIAYQANLPEIRAALFGEHHRATSS
jgi:V-type H+-transporting ATPase subunit E